MIKGLGELHEERTFELRAKASRAGYMKFGYWFASVGPKREYKLGQNIMQQLGCNCLG